MKRAEFINYLVENNIPYTEYVVEDKGIDQVYVFSRKEHEMVKAHPKKYKNLYVPYLRVSHFDGDRWYTRENGFTSYMSIEKILGKCKELGA